MEKIKYGVIGGSGLYEIDGIQDVKEHAVDTPFGTPSDNIITGKIDGISVAFLPRHGRGHTILPHEINGRANIYALKKLGVEKIISVSAVGSMKEHIKPGTFHIPDQLFDRTKLRISSFLGDGIAGHVQFADPYCKELSKILYEKCTTVCETTKGGTYICIDGPQFSTRAESNIYRSWGVDIIGMTNLPEAKLAREAEMCYATIALVTDYDVWHEEDVSVEAVVATVKKNVNNVKKALKTIIPELHSYKCSCNNALQGCIMTSDSAMPEDPAIALLLKK